MEGIQHPIWWFCGIKKMRTYVELAVSTSVYNIILNICVPYIIQEWKIRGKRSKKREKKVVEVVQIKKRKPLSHRVFD